MSIYTSIPAYVYKLTCTVTNQFYYGFRKAHIKAGRTPKQDFLVYYFSSSKAIKLLIDTYGIDKFNGEIIYCDTDEEAAFWYEQELIKDSWSNPLLLNKQYRVKEETKGVFLSATRTAEVTERMHATKIKKYGTLSPIREGSIEKMVATRKARDNYKQGQPMIDKMLATKLERGKMNSNTPESLEKSRQTRMEKYGTHTPSHTPETIAKLKLRKNTPESKAKCLETKRLNGTMNSNSPAAVAQRRATLLAKWGTTNTRAIGKLKNKPL